MSTLYVRKGYPLEFPVPANHELAGHQKLRAPTREEILGTSFYAGSSTPLKLRHHRKETTPSWIHLSIASLGAWYGSRTRSMTGNPSRVSGQSCA